MAFQKQLGKIIDAGKEKILLIRVKNKDKSAFVEAYDKYVDQVYRFIYFKVSDKEEVKDLTSLTFLKAWEYIQDRGINEDRSIKALFYKIARNVVIDYYRAQSKRQVTSIELLGEIRSDVDIITNLENKLEIERVSGKMLQLKSEYREVLMFYYVDELSTREIAKILGKTSGNIRVTLHRALKTFKEIVNE
ncbi:RNA polymerase sigma factor [Patescibacteria group bacterium]|nr:RNA polymerase sigma factor [Patescibacteria group bacterium]